jgi:hypothetical protein
MLARDICGAEERRFPDGSTFSSDRNGTKSQIQVAGET